MKSKVFMLVNMHYSPLRNIMLESSYLFPRSRQAIKIIIYAYRAATNPPPEPLQYRVYRVHTEIPQMNSICAHWGPTDGLSMCTLGTHRWTQYVHTGYPQMDSVCAHWVPTDGLSMCTLGTNRWTQYVDTGYQQIDSVCAHWLPTDGLSICTLGTHRWTQYVHTGYPQIDAVCVQWIGSAWR